MALTPAEERELAELNSLAHPRTSSKLTREEEEELNYLNKMASKKQEPEKSWLQSAGEHALDILEAPRAVGRGMANVADMVSWPVRKGLEQVIGRDIPTLAEQGASYNPRTATGRVMGHAGEFLGETLAGGPVGRGLSTWAKVVKNPIGKKSLTKTGEFLGDFTSPEQARMLAGVGAGAGAASGLLQEAGMDPLMADITGAVGVPGAVWAKGRGVPFFGNKATERKLLKDIEKNVSPEELKQIHQRLGNYQTEIPSYTPSTADIAQHPYFSNLERAYHGHTPSIMNAEREGTDALEEAIHSLRPSNSNVGATSEHFHGLNTSALKDAEKRVSQDQRSWERSVDKATNSYNKAIQKRADLIAPYQVDTRKETGNKLVGSIEDYLSREKAHRREVSSPLFEGLKDIQVVDPFKHSENYLMNVIEKTDPIRTKIQSLLGNLNKTRQLSPEIAEIEKRYGHYGEKALNKIKESYGFPLESSGITNAAEIQQTLENLGDAIYTARRGGNWSDAFHLEQFKKALEQDVAGIAELGNARGTYKGLSKNIGHLESDKKGLAKAIKKDVYGNHYQTGATEVPELFFRGKKAVANTENLLKHVGNDKRMLEGLRSQLREDVVNSVTNSAGEINFQKLHKYGRDNPAAYLIDPNFNKFKDKLVQSQVAVNRASLEQKKINRSQPKSDTRGYLGEHEQPIKSVLGNRLEGLEEAHVVGNILSGKNKALNMERVVNLAKNSPAAVDGLKAGAIEHILRNIDLKNPGKRTVDFFRDNHTAMSKLFTPAEMKLYKDLQNAVKARHDKIEMGKTRGSPTASNLSILGEHLGTYGEKALQKVLDKFLYGIGGAGRMAFKEIKHNKKKNLISKALTQPNYTKELISRVDPYRTTTSNKKGIFGSPIMSGYMGLQNLLDAHTGNVIREEPKPKKVPRIEIRQGTRVP